MKHAINITILTRRSDHDVLENIGINGEIVEIKGGEYIINEKLSTGKNENNTSSTHENLVFTQG